MTKMLRIRREYGESFCDVVKGYAELGYSRTLTAAVLGINLSYFRQLCSRFDLHRHYKPQGEMRRDCKGGGGGWPKGRPRFTRHKPIERNGFVWRPGEPTYHYLRSLGRP